MIYDRGMVEVANPPDGSVRVPQGSARKHVSRLFERSGVPEEPSDLIADVLVSADARGIRSHGLARVPYFLLRLASGVISADPEMTLTVGSATTAVLDACNGVGIVAADVAMRRAISMAGTHGSGFVVVKDSSHFGYAGYWADRAAREGCIGISLSNSGRRVAPTFGTDAVLGTNPLAVAIPGGSGGTDFLLDMATSTVAVGKVESALREERDIPEGWLLAGPAPELDKDGVLTYGAPLLPLGGEGTTTGGHKGYGLGLLVELLCGALGGTGFTARIAGADGTAPPAMGHLMGALRIDGFRPTEHVQRDMQETFDHVRESGKADGHDRIFIHGEPESISEAETAGPGIVVSPPVLAQLERWAKRLDVEPLVA